MTNKKTYYKVFMKTGSLYSGNYESLESAMDSIKKSRNYKEYNDFVIIKITEEKIEIDFSKER